VFDSNGTQRYRTADLIAELTAIEESPWGDWYGKTITPQGLSRLLKPYRIRTMPVWVDGSTVKGYKREQFEDAWRRVLGALGVRTVREVRGESASQNAPNPPNPPNPQGSDRAPVPGDDGFLAFVAAAYRAGHITTTEALEREAVHHLVATGLERVATR
jgi:hypothetical protein